ncbi:MAG: 3-phosphoshikimate 1-carboxyvinyltransferase [Ruminococcus sp.]|nr:3-phosphoshikimate 1-carboxyvinyltransferase [Ruminococcus sp.]
MRVEIRPSKAKGAVDAPPSKSMAHRLLICAGLAEGRSTVRNLALSEDIKATIACLRSLGADIRLKGNTAHVKGTDVTKPTGSIAVLPCSESGSTLRFFIPICMLNGEERVLTGSQYLLKRPLNLYETVARMQQLRFEKFDNRAVVQGPLREAVFICPGGVSSQFFSGMMFALPLLKNNSWLYIREPVESRPYIDMTASALGRFGVGVLCGDTAGSPEKADDDQLVYKIPGGGRYIPQDVTVEGDWSNAAFFEALNYAGGKVTVRGLLQNSLQGDKVYPKLFAKIKDAQKVIDIGGIDISDCPDLGPVLFAVAALCGGARFTGTRRLKYKESDRANAMKQELEKLGVGMTVEKNEVVVHNGRLCPPRMALSGHNDHRIVMALSVLLTVTGGVIEGAEAVKKSFPDFFERLHDLGVDLTYGMD